MEGRVDDGDDEGRVGAEGCCFSAFETLARMQLATACLIPHHFDIIIMSGKLK